MNSLFWMCVVLFFSFTRFAAGTQHGVDQVVGGVDQVQCPAGKLCNPIKYGNLNDFLLAILDVVVKYGAILVVFFIVFAGFKFVTAQGNTEKIADARKMFVWVVVGAFVLLGVYVIRAAICGTLKNLGVPNLQC